jgi:hypothetical protein
MSSAHCAETSLQAVKLATQQKPFDVYHPATGLGGVAENNLQKCFMDVADLSQSTEFMFWLCFVILVWTRPNRKQQVLLKYWYLPTILNIVKIKYKEIFS